MFVVYAILVHVAFVLLLPLLVLHSKLREGFWFRLGCYPEGWPGCEGKPVIWLHGASAGDLLAIQPVLRELRRREPQACLVVTTVTNSGMAVGRRMREADACGYLPYDLPWSVARAMAAIRPDLLVLEYTEVWPALIRGAARAGARIAVINGRFNERALARYRWFYRLIGNPLRHVDLLCMRDQDEADHALAIGAEPGRVRVTGNTKFDSCRVQDWFTPEELESLGAALGIGEEALVWVAGSTHEGEEDDLLDVFSALRASHPRLRLVIAPRYMERTERVVGLCHEKGLACGLRSRNARDEPVVVLDSVGELREVYRLATVVFVGGSFVRRGGQNILEPAVCGKPVLFGPHMENFRGSVRVLLGRGGIQVSGPLRLERVLGDLLARPEEIAKLGAMAREAVTAVQGATEVCTRELLALAEPGAPAP